MKEKNLRKTCLRLTELGIKTKQFTNKKGELKGGNHFTVQSLHHVLVNATYVGLREINKKRGDTKCVKASWSGIVDEKDFLVVQSILQKNKQRYKPDEWKTYPYPLTGITTCGECGSKLNGKSAHGKTQKHHYYDHPRLLRSSGMGHVHSCEVQRVRAQKIEEIVSQSLKTILNDSILFDAAIKAYKESQNVDLPIIKTRMKALSLSIKENEKRVDNLVNRISELPAEVSAAPLYKKLEELQSKITEEKNIQGQLEIEKLKTSTKNLDDDALKLKLQGAIKKLDEAPKEKQREIFTELLQFVEVHASKIRLGVYTPASYEKRQSSAHRGSTAASGNNVISILRGNQESTQSSCTFKNGGFFAA